MLDILSTYLDATSSPEEKQHIALADRFLQRIEDENYEHVIEEILMLDEEMDSGTAVHSIVQVYRTKLYQFFTQHAWLMGDDLSLAQLAELANGLYDLQNTEGIAYALESLDESAPLTENVCGLLTQTTRYSVDELLQMVDNISDSFLQRLKAVVTTEPEPEDDTELAEQRARMQAYRKYEVYLSSLGVAAPQIDAVLRSGNTVGLPYLVYATLLDRSIPLETMPSAQLALELFGAALVSHEGSANPGDVVKANLEQFISDARKIAEVMVEIRNIMMGYQP